MVKRKADISLDEWLAQSVGATGSIPNHTAAAPTEQTVNQVPTVVEISPGAGTTHVAITEPVVESAPVAEDRCDVAGRESEAAEWFWLLLEQSGYERW